jgi:RimJ/RimL family protein N-acetyltransferase
MVRLAGPPPGREVALEPLTLDYARELAVAASESRESFAFTPVPDGEPAARAYIEKALRACAAGERLPFAIRFRGRIVGSTSYSVLERWEWPAGSPLQRVDRPDVVEIGTTWLAASAQRTRCNTEAKYLLLGHAFETWQVHRVHLRTDERNQRSRDAIVRLGAKFEGIRRADRPGLDGVVRNSAFYSIVLSEWPEVRDGLERRLARP